MPLINAKDLTNNIQSFCVLKSINQLLLATLTKLFFSSMSDDAVPGAVEVPPRPEEEVWLRVSESSPAGFVLCGGTSSPALHYRDEDEEHVNAGKEQGRRRDYLRTGAWVRRTETSYL